MDQNRSIIVILALVVTLVAGCEKPDTSAPWVVTTSPQNGSQNVSTSVGQISVTFNEEMMDQSWSWAYMNKRTFPTINGQIHYTDNNTKNILPVHLESDKSYVVWINTQNLKKFKDKSGNPAVPFRLEFKTK
ncbi:MAG: Ig-like domain-containing protein [Gammaproteobacteria bacterium]|nr:Ig-like domain-containing protein [Gammaproteobacteria bacterium]